MTWRQYYFYTPLGSREQIRMAHSASAAVRPAAGRPTCAGGGGLRGRLRQREGGLPVVGGGSGQRLRKGIVQQGTCVQQPAGGSITSFIET